jgi:decaprenylphospho-beta-D-erythro-pentofuranosid-2-ulose 2-reductase
VTTPVVLVVGATSAIAQGAAAAFARRGCDLYVAGRDRDEIDRIASDLRVRYGIAVHSGTIDATDSDAHAAFFAEALTAVGGNLEGIVIAFGLLGDHERATVDFAHAKEVIDVNFAGVASLLTVAANHFEQRRAGFLAVLSSVAGDRGRQSNYVYGASKAAVSTYLAGLRNRLAGRGVRVHTIKLGVVDTQMTYGLPGVRFAADPAKVGEEIVRAIERGKDVVYVPGLWRYIMLAIRLIPESVFKRLRL